MKKFEFQYNIKDLEQTGLCSKIANKFIIKHVASITNPDSYSLMFVQKLNKKIENKLLNVLESLIILPIQKWELPKEILENNECIYTENPRLQYAKIFSHILQKQRKNDSKYKMINNSRVGENVTIGENVEIEPFCVIENNSNIGNNCIIRSGTKVCSNVELANNVIIGENSVIGSQGFGFERDTSGKAYRLPHVGGVTIDQNVEIGARCTINSGTIDPTIIGRNVMIDDNVFIGHNAIVKEGCTIVGNAVIGGSSVIGEDTYFGPNSYIMNGKRVGRNCKIGVGSIAIKNISDETTVFGFPAKILKL